MDREPLANDRIALINAISQGDLAAIDRFTERWPKLDAKLDVEGNSALHYAVALFDVQIILHLIEVVGVDVAVQNRHGETPYDWWAELVKGSLWLDDPEKVALMLDALRQGDSDILIEGLGCGVSPRLRFLVEGSIGTILHWGIHYHQSDTVRVLLDNISDSSFLNLLTIRDSQGKTPSLLAKEKSQQGNKKATEILQYLQAKQHAIGANQGAHAQLPPANCNVVGMPADYEKHLTVLRKKLFEGIKEADYPLLRPTLPTLCALAYYTCQQALQQFAHQPFLENQALLLKRLSGNALEQLRQTIKITTNYLGNVLQKDRVNQVVELCVRYPGGHTFDTGGVGLALSDMHNEKIYLNLTPKILRGADVAAVVLLVIHEMSHLAAKTYDFGRTTPLIAGPGGTVFQLTECVRLAERAEYNPAFPVWNREVVEITRLLEPICEQQARMPLGQYLATQNADTIVLAAMGLPAITAGFGAFVSGFSPPIDDDDGRALPREWFVLEIDWEFFSSSRIKSALKESDAMRCRPQTPPPNGAICRDSDEEKQLPPKPRVKGSCLPLSPADVPKLMQTMAESSSPPALASSTSSTKQSNSERPTSHLIISTDVA